MRFLLTQLLILTKLYFANGFGLYGYNFQLKDFFDNKLTTDAIVTNWITQPLDHFNGDEKIFWQMRYMQRLDFWNRRSPIFLFIGGEGEISPGFLKSGLMYDLARETKGAMFMSEHRYYGKSIPNNDTSVENLKFLSSRQALADIATLLKFLKSFPRFRRSKVVVVGGSYAGNLAAWLKLLYPKLVDAAVASSAPVLAKKDFYEYLEKVNDNYEQYGTEDCMYKIETQFKIYEKLFESPEGIKKLKRTENICESNDLSKLKNKQTFFMSKISDFMVTSQYGTPIEIRRHCEGLHVNELSDTFVFYKEHKPFWKAKSGCNIYDYNEMIENMVMSDVYKSWMYQVCTEFGYFQTTTSDEHLFTKNVPLEYYTDMCVAMYGMEYNDEAIDRAINKTNEFYGGLKPNVTNVVFVNGDMDPWSRLGILEDVNLKAPAIVTSGASHCKDLFPNNKNDPKELKQSRKRIRYFIKKWISDEIEEIKET